MAERHAPQHEHDRGHDHGHDHRHAPGGGDWAEFGARLVREGELLRPVHDEAVGLIRRALGDHPVRRVLDLGSGPGVATTLLATEFADAVVTAVDASSPLLELAAERAAAAGVGHRVTTTTADLESPLGQLADDGPADLVWASMVLHHVASVPDVLAEIASLLPPGGVLALVEFGDDRRVLPAGSVPERPGFVDRLASIARAALEAHLPPGALDLDWPSLLQRAGFEVVDHRRAVLERRAPLDAPGRAVVTQSLEMVQRIGLHLLDDDDLITLARLLDDEHPASVARRDDLSLRLTRTLVVARRP